MLLAFQKTMLHKITLQIALHLIGLSLCAQTLDNLTIKGDYTVEDSVNITEAFLNAYQAVVDMHAAVEEIWRVKGNADLSKRDMRHKLWLEDSAFVEWLGQPNKVGMVHRRIDRMQSKFGKRFILEVTKENKGRCHGWISAWTIPYGKVRIRLCEDYFRYRTHLQEKILIHELGHEVGMLFHRKVHGCWAARRAAASRNNHIVKRSPENYAWLAMHYFGMECDN